jgi:hypothetical protein
MKTTPNQVPGKIIIKPDYYEEGRLFEQYIINLFNKKNFRLETWRESRKKDKESIPLEHSYPDLELIFVGAKKYRFAVECKWRSKFNHGKIRWAKPRHLESYIGFQLRFGIPLFIAIGIGGQPSSPQKLFVTPFQNINRYTEVYESQLIPFERKPTHRFFYDTVQLRLF